MKKKDENLVTFDELVDEVSKELGSVGGVSRTVVELILKSTNECTEKLLLSGKSVELPIATLRMKVRKYRDIQGRGSQFTPKIEAKISGLTRSKAWDTNFNGIGESNEEVLK